MRKSDINLYPHQEQLVDSIFESLKNNKESRPVAVGVTSFGKSLCIADMVERIHKYQNQRVLILVPNKELILQNESEIKLYNPEREVYAYSASVNRKEIGDTMLATIGSVVKLGKILKPTVIIIDECDVVSTNSKTQYQKFFNDCPKSSRFVGLTGTPFRLKGGLIYGEDGFFTECCYDSSDTKVFNELTNNGYLSRIKTKQSGSVLMDSAVKGLRTLGGDFTLSSLSDTFDKDELTQEIVDDIITYKDEYKHMLIFCIDIQHAENTCRILNERGITAKVFHSQMEDNRSSIIQRFKDGEFQALVNVDILTRGFSFKQLNFIALLRNTKSHALFRQIVGRLLRPHPDKPHGLFLDYTDSSVKLGAINVPVDFSKKKVKGSGGDMCKVCPECGETVHIAAKICPDCGYEYPEAPKLKTKPSDVKIVKEPEINIYEVYDVSYKRHKKANSPDALKVSYHCGLSTFSEWICLDHDGYAYIKATQWVEKRNGKSISVDEALVECKDYPKPIKIKVDESEKYSRVVDYKFIQ